MMIFSLALLNLNRHHLSLATRNQRECKRLPFFIMGYFVYVLYSASLNRFYIGQTNNMKARLERHNTSDGFYTSRGKPWELIWSCKKPTRSDAVKLERKLKNLSKARLKSFMLKYSDDISEICKIEWLRNFE